MLGHFGSLQWVNLNKGNKRNKFHKIYLGYWEKNNFFSKVLQVVKLKKIEQNRFYEFIWVFWKMKKKLNIYIIFMAFSNSRNEKKILMNFFFW